MPSFVKRRKIRKSLLTLGQRIGFFIAPHVQQFGGTYLKIPAKADIEPEHVLLMQRGAVEAFEADIVLVHQVGIYRSGGPDLGAPVADIDEIEFYPGMTLTFFSDH